MFNPPGPFGPQNMPAHINAESTEADFLNLFLDDYFGMNMAYLTGIWGCIVSRRLPRLSEPGNCGQDAFPSPSVWPDLIF